MMTFSCVVIICCLLFLGAVYRNIVFPFLAVLFLLFILWEAPAIDKDLEKKIYYEGYKAALIGMPKESCDCREKFRKFWEDGWEKGKNEKM